MKKYKYSRKEIIKKYLYTKWRYYFQLADDLLAEQEDKKECGCSYKEGLCKKHLKQAMLGNHDSFSPSLPEFEEIEPIQPDDIPMSDDVDFLVGKINQIVNTLNKLIKQK